MSINLHINGETPGEFEAALRSVVALLGGTGGDYVATVLKQTDPVMQEVRDADAATAADKPAATRTPRKKAEPVAKEPEGNANAASAASSETETTSAPASTTEDTGSGTATSASPSDEVTIEDIRELTLKVVDKCGKAGIEAVLETFGVARATQVPEEQRPELRDALQAALDAAVAA